MNIKKTLFASADWILGSMDPGEYNHVALGLIFLRYVSESFEQLHLHRPDRLDWTQTNGGGSLRELNEFGDVGQSRMARVPIPADW